MIITEGSAVSDKRMGMVLWGIEDERGNDCIWSVIR